MATEVAKDDIIFVVAKNIKMAQSHLIPREMNNCFASRGQTTIRAKSRPVKDKRNLADLSDKSHTKSNQSLLSTDNHGAHSTQQLVYYNAIPQSAQHETNYVHSARGNSINNSIRKLTAHLKPNRVNLTHDFDSARSGGATVADETTDCETPIDLSTKTIQVGW